MDPVLIEERRGARRMADVPASVRALVEAGQSETVNLMEWLAADMSTLARSVAAECDPALAQALNVAAAKVVGIGVTGRLAVLGGAIAEAAQEGSSFELIASHRSDIVRQWACYAANLLPGLTLERRLAATLRFADDPNMSVRETAWMAFRPHLARDLDAGLPLLQKLVNSPVANVRRFAVEVSRPRSVWGAHVAELKRRPERGARLLEPVKADESRYVRLAVGNWLNDASKTRPDWVECVCARWEPEGNPHTLSIVRRGKRTLVRKAEAVVAGLFETSFAGGAA